MRRFTTTLLTIGIFTTFSVACNDRAEMGHGPQRRSGGDNVIPADFTNAVSPDDLRARARQLAQDDTARGLTLSPTLEPALQLAGSPGTSDTGPWGAFPAACPTLSQLTGNILSAAQIRELSLQTSFALTKGDANQTACTDLVRATGIEVFRTLKALRFLAETVSATDSLSQDCVNMQPKAPGRRYALAWSLSGNNRDTWLTDHQVTDVTGEVTGGGRDGQTALSAWANLAGAQSAGNQQIITSVNALIDETTGVTTIENIGEYTHGAESLRQKNMISYDVHTGSLTETSVYENRKDGGLISERRISATVKRSEDGLTLTLTDSPDDAGTDTSVELSLDATQALHCTVR